MSGVCGLNGWGWTKLCCIVRYRNYVNMMHSDDSISCVEYNYWDLWTRVKKSCSVSSSSVRVYFIPQRNITSYQQHPLHASSHNTTHQHHKISDTAQTPPPENLGVTNPPFPKPSHITIPHLPSKKEIIIPRYHVPPNPRLASHVTVAPTCHLHHTSGPGARKKKPLATATQWAPEF
jgi:hypothetical protein